MRLHDLGEQRIHIGLLVTSAAAASAAPPLSRISATMPSSTSLRRATSTVLAPSAAKFSVMALPMPELAPVTMATRSSSCFMGDSLIRYHGDGAHLDQVLGARPSWSPLARTLQFNPHIGSTKKPRKMGTSCTVSPLKDRRWPRNPSSP